MGDNKKYWNGLEDLEGNAPELARKNEFVEELPLEESLSEEKLASTSTRRDFLKIFGFGLTAATLAACETPLKKAIPYVNKPENITPGVANWYASTCSGCASNCGILVKTREGRPIKIEGNPTSYTKGGVCAVGQATVLSLYDSERLKDIKGAASWVKADEQIKAKLAEISNGGGKIFVVMGSVSGAATLAAIQKFTETYKGATLISWEPVSYSGIAKAHGRTHGRPFIPSYRFDLAEVVVSFSADFLGTWISPMEFTRDYTSLRKVNRDNPGMSWHMQVESRMSLTGSNADKRIPVNASKEGIALLNLYNKIAGKLGGEMVSVEKFELAGNALEDAANRLVNAQGKSLVVSGSNDTNVQEVVNRINMLLKNYGSTINAIITLDQHTGDEAGMKYLMDNIGSGQNAVIIMGSNPVYDYYQGDKLSGLIKGAALSVYTGVSDNETAAACTYALPDHHYLESWNDHHPRTELLTITQPAIRPIFESRQAGESMLNWSGDSNTSWYDYIRQTWETKYFPSSGYLTFDDFWNKAVAEGQIKIVEMMPPSEVTPSSDLPKAASAISAIKPSGMDIVFYENTNLRDGSMANNPWLQEAPDPISKITWENFVSIPFKYGKEKGLRDGDLVTVKVNSKSLKLPVYIQPGQANNTLAVALGYGRKKGGKLLAKVFGENAFSALAVSDGQIVYMNTGASIENSGEYREFAKVQTFTGYELAEGTAEEGTMTRGRIEKRVDDYILKETTLAEYKDDRTAGNKNRPAKEAMMSLWKEHKKEGYHWAMAIDLNACTGCGACIVACSAENNIPVVGRDEVRRRRELHWIRIDRYFTGNPADESGELRIAHQPMLCQHCDNAPCETVCPVLATVHSVDGLNQQAYNRCIGTRYCANNCPYKVRRFNWFSYYDNDWFDFNMNDRYGKLVLNPDVTVRARGTMEKCSFCVQRIQEKKLVAKTESRRVYDGEIQTACQQSCPAGAIIFGDINDPNSEVNRYWRNERAFHALEDVKTLPGIAYMTKVRNIEPSKKDNAPKKDEHHS